MTGSATARWMRIGLAVLIAVVAASRLLAVRTENINWDEFALLQRAEISARSGEVQGGGRPGLATVVLMPLADACRDAIATIVQARLIWTLVVAASAFVLWRLLYSLLETSRHRSIAALTGAALWTMAPPLLRFSTQVRTDQPAVLFGLLGGWALLASRVRPAVALLAGALMGVGFLFSQKLLYVGALMAVLAAGQQLLRGEWIARREVLRIVLSLGSFVAVVAAYRVLVDVSASSASVLPVRAGLRTFEHYRQNVGWTSYINMLPLLIPQLLLLLALPFAWARWAARRESLPRELFVATAVVALGAAVTLFHAARFPYFYIVLGLFPAVAGALVLSGLLDQLQRARSRTVLLMVLWEAIAILVLFQAAGFTRDAQAHQRASLAFVQRNFDESVAGYNSRAAFVCRGEEAPFPAWFLEHLRARFGTAAEAERNTQWLLDEFRTRPVAFLIPPMTGEPFPDPVWDFWDRHYVHYHGAVHIAGTTVAGGPGAAVDFEVIAPGDYVWRPDGDAGPLGVGDDLLRPGEPRRLEPGRYRLSLPEGGRGMFVLAVRDAPAPDDRPFYTAR